MALLELVGLSAVIVGLLVAGLRYRGRRSEIGRERFARVFKMERRDDE